MHSSPNLCIILLATLIARDCVKSVAWPRYWSGAPYFLPLLGFSLQQYYADRLSKIVLILCDWIRMSSTLTNMYSKYFIPSGFTDDCIQASRPAWHGVTFKPVFVLDKCAHHAAPKLFKLYKAWVFTICYPALAMVTRIFYSDIVYEGAHFLWVLWANYFPVQVQVLGQLETL